MALTKSFKITKKGFHISELMRYIDVDYIYSYNQIDNIYLLLKQDMLGEISPDIVNKQKDLNRIIIITESNTLEAYNIDSDEFDEGIANMEINSKR